MLRALFSAITVLLLCVIAFLVYNNYVAPGHLAEIPHLPVQPVVQPLPPPPAPLPPVQPLPPPTQPPVQPEPPRAITELPKAEPKTRRTHVVRAGDSLWAISMHYYGTADYVQKLSSANGLKTSLLRKGQVLVIPDLPHVSPKVSETEETVTPESVTPKDETADKETKDTKDTATDPTEESDHEPKDDVTHNKAPDDFTPLAPTLNTVRPREKK